jgi:DNA-binding LytR/AlgR family response regulator
MWQLKYLKLYQDLFLLTLLFLQSGKQILHLAHFSLVTKQQQAYTLKFPNLESLNNFSMQSILWIEARHNNINIKSQTTLTLSSLLTQKPPFQPLLTKRRILRVYGANYLSKFWNLSQIAAP